MVPPGDNLEFQASGAFRDRTINEPTILEESKATLRRNPTLGSPLAGNFKRLDLQVADSDYVIFFKRNRNVIAFIAIFDAEDQASIEAKKKELASRIAKGELK